MTLASSLLALFLAAQCQDPIAELTRKSVLALKEMSQADRDHAEGRYDAAVVIYAKYLEDPDFDPGRFIPGSGRHGFAAQLRISAQGRLPSSLEAARRYKEALAEYETPIKYYGVWRCWNSRESDWKARRAGSVRCLEALLQRK